MIRRKISYFFALFAVLLFSRQLAAQIEQPSIVAVFTEHEKYVETSYSYGLPWKILELAAQQQKLKLEWIGASWQASINRLKAGKVDLVFGALRTQEREKWASSLGHFVAVKKRIFRCDRMLSGATFVRKE